MPTKFCKWSVNNQVNVAPHFKAKIDIGERPFQAFIESARFLKNVTPREHTRARNGAAVSSHLQLAIHTRMFCRTTVKSRLRTLMHTHTHPRLFDRSVRIQQSRAYGSNFCPLYMLRHDRQPVRFDRFDSLTQEKNPWIVCFI